MKNVPPLGKFTRKVQFRNPGFNPVNAGGVQEQELPPFLEAWAAIEQVGQSRTFDAAVDQTITEYDIWTYFQNDLAANLKRDTILIYNGSDYSINSVEPVEEGINRFYLFKVVGVK